MRPSRTLYFLHFLNVIAISLLLALNNITVAHAADIRPLTNAQRTAIASIESQRGKVTLDENGQVIKVDFIAARGKTLDLTPLKLLTTVKEVNLSYNLHIGDGQMASLAGLTELRRLELDQGIFTDAGMAHFKGLVKLESLGLYNCKAITDVGLTNLAGLRNLRWLNLGSTRITDNGLAHLAGLRNLRTLDLGTTRISDAGLEHLKGLAQIDTLLLFETRVGDRSMEIIAGFPNMRRLVLASTRITDNGLAHLARLTNLVELDLSNTRVTYEGLVHLCSLRLKKFNLRGTRIRGEDMMKLKTAQPNCTIAPK